MEFKSVLEQPKSKKRIVKASKDTRKVKGEKVSKEKKERENWKEIKNETDKKEFQEILSILNRYYGQKNEFREKLVLANPESFSVKLKSKGGNAFSVLVELDKVLEIWTHLDGIVEERKTRSKKGNLNHPVFTIVCLTDLYEKAVKCKTPKLINLKVGKK